MLDTGDRRRGLPADRVDRGDDARPLETGWTLLRANAAWASNHQDRAAARTPRARTTLLPTSLATAVIVSCRWYAAIRLAPRRTALLRNDGSSVERKARAQVLWRVGLQGVGNVSRAAEW